VGGRDTPSSRVPADNDGSPPKNCTTIAIFHFHFHILYMKPMHNGLKRKNVTK